ALDIVVEGDDSIAIALEHSGSVVLGEILPLQQHKRPASPDSAYEGFYEIIVILAANPLMPPTDIERIGEAVLVVGPDIENDGQGGRGVEPAAGGVKRQLADRDSHAVGALVAQPQYALAVGNHDRLNAVKTWVGQNLVDPVFMR